MLTAGQLSKMRRTANRLLPTTATILRRTLEDDGAGGQTESYAANGTARCRLSTVSERTRAHDRAIGNRIDTDEGFLVALPVGTDVLETDRLTINGTTYAIVSPADERSDQVLLRFVLKRL
jgi:head-tail joining protein